MAQTRGPPANQPGRPPVKRVAQRVWGRPRHDGSVACATGSIELGAFALGDAKQRDVGSYR